MPIESDILYGVVMGRCVCAFPSVVSDKADDDDANQHVQGMEAGHGPVKVEEHLHLLLVGAFEMKGGPGEFVLQPVAVVLDTFDGHEAEAEDHGQDEEN